MPLQRGALIEYGSDFLGPIPNLVIFQFNPETLTRNIQIPSRPTGAKGRESHQAGELPVERVSLTAYFSAADQLNDDNALARTMGIGPRLAALEKIARPPESFLGAIGAAIDAVAGAISGGDDNSTQPIPRETYPRVLFIWGPTRILPIIIDSMSITEQEYDYKLVPVRAQVELGMSVISGNGYLLDTVAQGALQYSSIIKDGMVIANLANTASQAVELIPF